ncbi:hypothetical protein FXW78_25205 [Rhodococcus opacus]|nr:hypothetical protein [Rhodococcus opacus]
MDFLDIPDVSNHLTNWTAWAGWLGGWTTLLLAVLLGAVAVFTARTAYWKLGGEDRWWWLWPLTAAILWVVSIWVLAVALSDLSRHSTNSQVVASTCIGGALVSAVSFYPAIKAADAAYEEAYYRDESRLRGLVGAVPVAVVFVTAIAVVISEYSIRGELFLAFMRLAIGIAFVGFLVWVVWKVVSLVNGGRSTYRH